MIRFITGPIIVALALFVFAGIGVPFAAAPTDSSVDMLTAPPGWEHLSSTDGDLPLPSDSTQQTASLVLDVDRDGIDDFVIGIRKPPGPSMVWYRGTPDGWTRYLIDDDVLDIEAGGVYHDIDGDGDLDVVMGGDSKSNRMWWWENPYPDYDPTTSWVRREIKSSGLAKHHDQIFGDFDGDGQAELVFWNQKAKKLFLAEIPSNPQATQAWHYQEIYSWNSGSEHEGLAKADIDGDGKIDIVGGGRWFKHNGGTSYTANIIDDGQRFARAAAGQLKAGGGPEVVFVPGDDVGRLKWYEWTGDAWLGHDLLGFEVDHGHSLDLADVDADGNLDIFVAEMRLNGDNPDAKMWLFFGDGSGNFTPEVVAEGYGNHESRLGDLDGDGDLDILGKPYNWETPRLDVWLNTANSSLDHWERHVVDASRPWRAVFITSADINGDGLEDIITGGWWYQNPGVAGGTWTRHTIGTRLNNMAAVYDFDGDGDVDVLGTEGKGSAANASFVWARNDGSGSFTILDNIANGDGDFLQGVAVGRFGASGDLEVALSWHQDGKGVQMLTVPADPASVTWPLGRISAASQNEALSSGDIDGDGDIDLLLGTKWLRNDGASWSVHTLNPSPARGWAGRDPDRNHLVDINEDGRLDAVVGFEAISQPGKLAWYEQGSSPTDTWTEHVIASPVGPMSLDVADMDQDGDVDVVVGEHNTSEPSSAGLYIFENAGQGASWTPHLVHTGDEHHDGAQVVDIDDDGDLDIISIGWTHDRVLLYENQAIDGELPTQEITQEAATPGAVGEEPAASSGSQQVLYTFKEGRGATIHDVSGFGMPLDLEVVDEAAIDWLPGGGLAIHSATLLVSTGAATKIIDAVQTSNELTVEAWVRPDNITQDGPARIVTLSRDSHHRNFTLGQGLWGNRPSQLYDVRLRTTETDSNGRPSLSTPAGTLSAELSHVVYTRDASGTARMFVNGVQHASAPIGGELSTWDESYPLALANEVTGDRPWLGEFHLLAIYDRALSPREVQQRHAAGPGGG